MSARILSGRVGVEEAVAILRRGEVIALPAETVYGLAGDAFNPLAVARIFEAKGRPLTDPLIVHLPEPGWIERVALFESPSQRAQVDQLASAFWPGPLTLILKKHPDLPDLVTAGMQDVAVRVTAPSALVNTPGSLPSHYAPKKELQIIESDIMDWITASGRKNAALLAFRSPRPEVVERCTALEVLSHSGDLREAAAHFYGALRRLDNSDSDIIGAEALPEVGIGVAIMDRMRRASYGSQQPSFASHE